MKGKRFRLSESDTINAYLSAEGVGIIAQIYDSGYASQEAVFNALVRKVPRYAGYRVTLHISNGEKCVSLKRRIPPLGTIKRIYRNWYKCPVCKTEWLDEWSCMCNDRCPKCNAEIEPYESKLIGMYDK